MMLIEGSPNAQILRQELRNELLNYYDNLAKLNVSNEFPAPVG
jgi:hypothetical protein